MYLIAGTSQLTGAIDGVNTMFTAKVPISPEAVLVWNGLAHLPGQATDNGYSVAGQTVTLAETPVPGDTVVICQPSPNAQPGTPPIGPKPPPGAITSLAPTLSVTTLAPTGHAAPLPQGTATILRP